jgi:hypothetical protein
MGLAPFSDTRSPVFKYNIPPYKRWGSVEELTCHLQGSIPYGRRFSHKNLLAVADQGCRLEGNLFL